MGRSYAAIVVVLFFATAPHALAGPSNARLLARLQAAALGQQGPCEPWSVPPADRCQYVRDNANICYPDGGFQEYLAVHYCYFGVTWGWLSLLVLLVAAALAFVVLLTVSERFFCPALELISDYLRLPPVVAGATLLSFGNGAPDTFTQVAAIGQEGGAAVGMALSEPLGGGMFASNVVFGLVVLIASKQQAVIQRTAFLKDVGFYLFSLIIIAFMLADGKVTPLEAGTLVGLYVVYVCATFYTSRADEPLHADLAMHEFPPEDGGIDAHDSSSEHYEFLDSEVEHPEYIDATTSIREYDLEAAQSELDSSLKSSSLDSEPQGPVPGTAQPAGQQKGSSGVPGSRTLQALLSWRHRGSSTGVREPLLVAIDESPATSREGQVGSDVGSLSFEADSSAAAGGRRSRSRSRAGRAAEAAVRAVDRERELTALLDGSAQQQQGTQTDHDSENDSLASVQRHSNVGPPRTSSSSRGSPGQLPAPAFVRVPGPPDLRSLPPITARSAASGQQSPMGVRGFAANGRRTFTEGTLRGSSASPVAGDRADTGVHGWSPRAASDSGVPVVGLGYSPLGGAVSPRLPGTPYALTVTGLGPAGEQGLLYVPPQTPLTPGRRSTDSAWAQGDSADGLQQLHQQHFAEQVELLEQQAAEHDALLAAHEDHQEALKEGGMTFKHRVQYPFVQLLGCTMPRVGTGSGHRYGRWRACLLPLTVPLLWFAADPSLVAGIGWLGLMFGCGCAAVGSCIIWATYPASDVPRKALKGVFAVLAFVQAIVWLNLSASGLVQICVVVGTIFGLKPALLGATVLAWGNSVPDLINNMAMAKDGFPSMAVAACFASPLFTLLVGMGGALTYGTVLHGGPLPIPLDGPLMVMAGFSMVNMVQHLIVVPWVHKYKMKPSLAVITFLFYACFNVVYGLATVGLIHIRVPQLSGA